MKWKVREDVQRKRVTNEELLFDPATEQFHFLNETAAFIYGACTGSNSIEDISAALSAEYSVEASQALVDVERVIHELAELGVLENVSSEIAAPPLT